jgi:hypothetical protein
MSTYRLMFEAVFGGANSDTDATTQHARRSEPEDVNLGRSPYGLAPECPLRQAYNEEAFRYFLEIERKRSELSDRPFMLLLIDVKKNRRSLGIDEVAAKIFSALSRCLRETDFIGWYREGRVVGAVLTQHADAAGNDLPDVVGRRIGGALRNGLPPEQADRLHVRVYQVPSQVKDQS